MSCKGCGNSTPTRVERPAASARVIASKRPVPLRPSQNYAVITIPKPANEDKHRI